MSSPSAIILGFGEAGPLARQSLASAEKQGITARYIALPGTPADLATAQPALWRQIKDALSDVDEAIVVWGHETLIVWDRLLRALEVSHRPDFLWPLPLRFANGGIEIVVPELFAAVGGFELSLYGPHALYAFHHAVTARALAKLLLVSDIETLTVADYLHHAWINFESVKAPDTWALHAPDNPLVFDNTKALHDEVGELVPVFVKERRNWVLGREALSARNRNTLAASEFVRSNLDQTQHRLGELMTAHPYFGFWPVKAGRAQMMIPCHGYHPAVAAHIWRGGHHAKAADLWNGVFSVGTYTQAIDTRDDGHVFGLMFAVQNPTCTLIAHAPSLREASWAQSVIETNELKNVTLTTERVAARPDAIAACTPASAAALWGKMDLFIPLDDQRDWDSLHDRHIPDGYVAYAYERGINNLQALDTLSTLKDAEALVLVHKDHHAKLVGGRV